PLGFGRWQGLTIHRGLEPRRMADNTKLITLETLQQVSDLSTPHMRAMNDAITEALPEHPDAMFTVGLTFSLCVLLDSLNPTDRRDRSDQPASGPARLQA